MPRAAAFADAENLVALGPEQESVAEQKKQSAEKDQALTEQVMREATEAQAEMNSLYERLSVLGVELSQMQVTPQTLEKFQALNQESQHLLTQARQATRRLMEAARSSGASMPTAQSAASRFMRADATIDAAANRAMDRAAEQDRAEAQLEEQGFSTSAEDATMRAQMNREEAEAGIHFTDEAAQENEEAASSEARETQPEEEQEAESAMESSSPSADSEQESESAAQDVVSEQESKTPETKENLKAEIKFEDAKKAFVTARERLKVTSSAAEMLKTIHQRLKLNEKTLQAESGVNTVDTEPALENILKEKKAAIVQAILEGINRVHGNEVSRAMREYLEDPVIEDRLLNRDFEKSFNLFQYNISVEKKQFKPEGLEVELQAAQKQAKLSRWKALITQIPFIGDSAWIQRQIDQEQNNLKEGLRGLRDALKVEKDAMFHLRSIQSDRKAISTIETQLQADARSKEQLTSAETAYQQVEKLEQDLQSFLARYLTPQNFARIDSSGLPEQLPIDFTIDNKRRAEYATKYKVLAEAQEAFKQTMTGLADTINLTPTERMAQEKNHKETPSTPPQESPSPTPAPETEPASATDMTEEDSETQADNIEIYSKKWDNEIRVKLQKSLAEVYPGLNVSDDLLNSLQTLGESARQIAEELITLKEQLKPETTPDELSDILEKRDELLEAFTSELRQEKQRDDADLNAAKEAFLTRWDKDVQDLIAKEGTPILAGMRPFDAISQHYSGEVQKLARTYLELKNELDATDDAAAVQEILHKREQTLRRMSELMRDPQHKKPEAKAAWDDRFMERSLRRMISRELTIPLAPDVQVLQALRESNHPGVDQLLKSLDDLRVEAESEPNAANMQRILAKRDELLPYLSTLFLEVRPDVVERYESLEVLKSDYLRNWDPYTLKRLRELLATQIPALKNAPIDKARALIHPANRAKLDAILVGLRKELLKATDTNMINEIVNRQEDLLLNLQFDETATLKKEKRKSAEKPSNITKLKPRPSASSRKAA